MGCFPNNWLWLFLGHFCPKIKRTNFWLAKVLILLMIGERTGEGAIRTNMPGTGRLQRDSFVYRWSNLQGDDR
jgi:hypothetical protein